MRATVGIAGHWLRRLLVPAYDGALARLAELLLALALLVLSLEAVGSFGGLRPGWMLVGAAVPAAVATGLGIRFAPRSPAGRTAPQVEPWALGVALLVAV